MDTPTSIDKFRVGLDLPSVDILAKRGQVQCVTSDEGYQMSDNQITVMLWIGVGVIRWLIWNNNATKARMYDDQERLKFQIMHLALFCAVGPFWLVSILRNLG